LPVPEALAPLDLALLVPEAPLLRDELALLLERADPDRRDRVAVAR
jgi:hypothetical protein